MSGFPFQIETRADLARAITLAEASGALGFAHLARALAAGRIALQPIATDTSASRFKAFCRLTYDRPAIVLIGDDDGLDLGPCGWTLAGRALTWARTVLVHGAGAERDYYEAAIIAAELTRRCMIIECSTATLPAWVRLVQAAPHQPRTLIIEPRGGVHPLPIDRGALH